jgi:hypothetical protein
MNDERELVLELLGSLDRIAEALEGIQRELAQQAGDSDERR